MSVSLIRRRRGVAVLLGTGGESTRSETVPEQHGASGGHSEPGPHLGAESAFTADKILIAAVRAHSRIEGMGCGFGGGVVRPGRRVALGLFGRDRWWDAFSRRRVFVCKVSLLSGVGLMLGRNLELVRRCQAGDSE